MMDPECPQLWQKRLYSWGMNQNPKKLRRPPCDLVNTQKSPPEEPAEQSDAPYPPAPSAMTPDPSGNQSQDTRRAWRRGRPRYLTTLDPSINPNDWVFTYLAERHELPAWWPESRSHYHQNTGLPSEVQVQELAQKHAMVFRLPTAQKEKSCWWDVPPSLIGFGCQDFLPLTSQTPGPQGHLCSKERPDSGTGLGPPAVCQTVGGSPWYTLQCHPGPLQMPRTSDWEGWPIDASMLEVTEEKSVASPTPMEEAIVLGEEPGPQGRGQLLCIHPSVLRRLLSLR